MIRLAIVSEGHSEKAFVEQVLAPHLQDRGVFAVAPLVRRDGRGGKVTMDALVKRMSEMTHAGPAVAVTSLVDLYGFVGESGASAGDIEDRADTAIRAQIGSRFNQEAVFAYVQQYEFEALLLSDAERARRWLQDTLPPANSAAADVLERAVRNKASPEDIDDQYDTAPARRIKRAFPSYEKTTHGPPLAAHIGLERMREECPRFGRWLGRLEELDARRR